MKIMMMNHMHNLYRLCHCSKNFAMYSIRKPITKILEMSFKNRDLHFLKAIILLSKNIKIRFPNIKPNSTISIKTPLVKK